MYGILTDIYAEKCLDKGVIAVTDARTYSQIFFDQAINRTLPIIFGCGIPITNSDPAKLLDLYNKWMTTGLFSAASLAALLSSDDMLLEFMDSVKNNDYPCVETDDKGEPCKYCSYARLCERVELEGED
ncbi:MAG: hypothetical protein IJJ13_09840 [Lachnospiraceae bacterium]|nr:hypothetical protein [Lachnospiraceae bacterium]